jgi:hypothetical protein
MIYEDVDADNFESGPWLKVDSDDPSKGMEQ